MKKAGSTQVSYPDYDTNTQYYHDIPLTLIPKKDYLRKNAKRFVINHTNQNVWIPNKHLNERGQIKPGENLDYIFQNAQYQLWYAGIFKLSESFFKKSEFRQKGAWYQAELYARLMTEYNNMTVKEFYKHFKKTFGYDSLPAPIRVANYYLMKRMGKDVKELAAELER